MSPLLQAQLLMVASALCASLVSLDSNYLTHLHQYFHWSQVLLANGLVGSILCTTVWAGRRCCSSTPPGSLFGERRGWLILRGIFGASENACAFLALKYMDLADANVIMFTNPVFTGIFAWLFFGQSWRWYDSILSCAALLGVVLVVRPPFLFGAERSDTEKTALDQAVGAGFALGFAITLAGANVLLNTKVREEGLNVVTFWMFISVFVYSLPSVIFVDPRGFAAQGLALPTLILFSTGFLFLIFQYSRSSAFQLSADASVANLLYSEVVFAFCWGVGIEGQPLRWTSVLGALIIMAGCWAVSWLKRREERAAGGAADEEAAAVSVEPIMGSTDKEAETAAAS